MKSVYRIENLFRTVQKEKLQKFTGGKSSNPGLS